MNRTARRAASLLGASALGLTTLGVATPAHASTAQDCLNTLQRANFAYAGPQGVVLTPTRRTMAVYFDVLDRSACSGITASIGISRPDGTQFRNQVASVSRTSGVVRSSVRSTMAWTDTGSWGIRQIAVKKDGVTAVRGFDPRSGPLQRVRRGVVLTGDVASPVNGLMDVRGTLKAYSTKGTLANMAPGRTVLLEYGTPGSGSYAYLGWAETNAYGQFSYKVDVRGKEGDYLRLRFPSPYTTIASGYTFLGRIPAS